MSEAQGPLGMVAGAGRPPLLVARGVRRAGRRLVVVGMADVASPRLAGLADEFVWAPLARIGRWIRTLRRHGVREVVLIGAVQKRRIYSPLRLLRYVPDWRTARLWYSTLRKDKRDTAVLRGVAGELQREGIEVVSGVRYCQEHLAHEGLMTRTRPTGDAAADIDFAWRIARASAALDIGQSVAVKERDIIAVEAMEGTDAMIRRAGRLCRVGGWTLVKVARPDQDMRFDVPTIGPETLRNLRDARCACLVLEAERTFIVDKPVALALADKLKIAVVGRRAAAGGGPVAGAP